MALSRRRLLLLAPAALAVGAGGLALWPGALRPPPGTLRVLSEREWSILAAAAQALCPGADGLPSADELEIASTLDAAFASFHPGDVAELKQALRLLDNALPGLLLDGRWGPFSRASAQARAQTLLAWRTSRIRLRRRVYKALHGLVMTTYWGHPRTWPHVGYPGPPDFGQAQAPPDDLLGLARVAP